MNDELVILLEGNVGEFSHSPRYKVDVYEDDDGAIPHFHVYGKNPSDNNAIDTCIEIATNRYFRHGTHKDTMTDGKERKLLNRFLRAKPTTYNGRLFPDNWTYIKYLWNMKKRLIYVDATEIPDYTTIFPEIKNDPRLKGIKTK